MSFHRWGALRSSCSLLISVVCILVLPRHKGLFRSPLSYNRPNYSQRTKTCFGCAMILATWSDNIPYMLHLLHSVIVLLGNQANTSLLTTDCVARAELNTTTPLLREFVPEWFTLSVFVLKRVAEFKGNCQQHKIPYCFTCPHGLWSGSCWEAGFPLCWRGATATEITLTQRGGLDFLYLFSLCLLFIFSIWKSSIS